MQSKTFILGVGAQKAGTSWLHKYLNDALNADFGKLKEYHVWDALHVPECANLRVDMSNPDLTGFKQLRGAMQSDEDAYFGYFCGLLERPGVDVTGDVTPAYSALQRPVLRRIADGFAKRSVRCKAVFLMRDPVDRCLSAFKMGVTNGRRESMSDEAFQQKAYGAEARIRTRYDLTVAELEASFDPDHIFIGIYEQLFCEPELARLSHFAGVTKRLALIDLKPRASRSTFQAGLEARKAVASHFRAVYEFAARRFPQTQALWDGFKLL